MAELRAILFGLFLASGAAFAQPAKVWRVGFIDAASDTESFQSLREGMRDLGYAEGRNVRYEVRRDAIAATGAAVWRTDQHGTITVTFDGAGTPIVTADR